MSSSRDVTGLLDDWTRGDARALDRLLPLVYEELRHIAARQLRRERAGPYPATDRTGSPRYLAQ